MRYKVVEVDDLSLEVGDLLERRQVEVGIEVEDDLVVARIAAERFRQLRLHQHKVDARPRYDVYLQEVDEGAALRGLVVASGQHQDDEAERAQHQIHRALPSRGCPTTERMMIRAN